MNCNLQGTNTIFKEKLFTDSIIRLEIKDKE